jgi:hypothetical protein
MPRPWTDPEEQNIVEKGVLEGSTWGQIESDLHRAGYTDRTAKAAESWWYREQREPEEPVEGLTPTKVFRYLRGDKSRSLTELCDKFEVPPKIMTQMLEDMIDSGYNITTEKGRHSLPITKVPVVDYDGISIADMEGHKFHIAFWSDPHFGSKHSQPTALNMFLRYAYDEFGVRHFFNPGDTFSGVYGYRGHDLDLIPEARSPDRKLAHLAAERQVWLAENSVARLDGARHYILGGNHDFWHVTASGVDAVRVLCDRRDDMVYLGYDVCSVPLTDNAHLRLWHPSGGTSYAKSYRIQKAIENQSLEALTMAIEEEDSPKVSILMAGHLHQAVWVPSSPIYGGMAGCFEGQTNYLKKKALFPDVGGVIMALTFNDNGRISDIGYRWVPFTEIEEDWKNFPVPEIQDLDFSPDELDTLFKLE